MNELLYKIIENTSNKLVLNYLKIDFTDKTLHFQNWKNSRNGFDEGGIKLFDQIGYNIPIECKYSLDIHNIMINYNTGEIFAFHTGRYSLFFRCDFKHFGISNSDIYRKGYTFDCITDITELGENWSFLDKFCESENEQIEWSYKKTKC